MVSMEMSGIDETESMFADVRAAFSRNVVYVVGTNVEYAAYVEFGTSRMEAQPYLFPAASRVARDPAKHLSGADSLNDFIENLALAIEREAKERVPVDTGNLKSSIRAERIA